MHKNKRLHKTVSLIVSMLFLINNISWQAPYITRTAHKKDTLKEMAAALDGRTSESIGSMLMSGSIKVVPPGSIASKADSEGDLTDDELRIAVLCGQWEVVDMIWKAESGHPKGSLNLLPLSMSAYFGGTFRYDANDPDWVNRDRLVVSGGHTAPGLYVPQAEAGFRDRKQAVPMKELLPTLRQKGSPLQGHIDMTYTPADMSAGSLGKGPSAAAGMAHAGKMDDRDYFVEVEIGDSESTEGQISEAMDYIGFNRLDNVIIWENRNEKGLTGDLSRLTRADNLKRAEAFGFRTHLVRNGDDPAAVEAMRRQIRKEVEVARKELKRLQYLLEHKCIGPAQEANLSLWVEAAKEKIKPTYVQYITTPGAGLPGMQAHGEAPKTDQRDAAVTEIKRQLKELTGVDFDEAKRDAVMREFKQRVMITAEQKNRIDNENEKRVAARRAEMQAIADGVKYVSPVNPASNYATRSAGGDELVGIMKDDLGVVAIDLELEPSVKLSKAAKAFYFNHTIDKPTGRVIEAACREVNAANLAAGFATCGKIPVVHTFASFIPMMAEPLLTILNTSLPIILVGTHAGLATGPDGRTHQDPNSQRIIGALPGTELFESCDAEEARLIGRFIHKWAREVAQTGHTKGKAHIFYERRARLDTPIIRKPEGWEKEAERGFYVIYENDLAEKERISHPGLKVDVVIVSVGTPTYDAIEAAKELAKEGVSVRVINVTQHKSLIRNEENIRGFVVLIKDADNLITVCDALPETIGEYVNTVTIKTAIQHKSIRNLGIQLWGESATPAELYYEHGFDKTGIVQTALDAVKSSSAGKAKVTQADHSDKKPIDIERKRTGLSAGFFAWDRYSKGEQVIWELKVGEPLKNLNFAEGIEELTPAQAEIRLRQLTSRLRIAGALAEEGFKHLSGAELFSKAITLEKRAEQTNPLIVLKSLPQTPDAWAKYFENSDAYEYFKRAWSKQVIEWISNMLLPWAKKGLVSIGGERVKWARTETLQRVYQYKEAIFELSRDNSVIVGWNEAKPTELILKVLSPSKDFNIDKEGADLRAQRLFDATYKDILGMGLPHSAISVKSSSAGTKTVAGLFIVKDDGSHWGMRNLNSSPVLAEIRKSFIRIGETDAEDVRSSAYAAQGRIGEKELDSRFVAAVDIDKNIALFLLKYQSFPRRPPKAFVGYYIHGMGIKINPIVAIKYGVKTKLKRILSEALYPTITERKAFEQWLENVPIAAKSAKSSSAGYEYEEVAAGQIARFSERLMPGLEKSAREHIIVENIINSLDIPKLIDDIKKSTKRHTLRTLFIKRELKTLPLLKGMIDNKSGQIVSIRTESDSPALELMNLIGKIADQQEVDKPLMAVIFFDCVKAKEFIDRLCILEELRQKQPYEIAVKVAAYPILDPIRSNYTRELLSKFEGPKASDLKSSSAGITVEVNKVPAIFGYLDIEERDSIRSIISGLTGKDGLRSSDPWIKTWAAINLSLFDKNIIYKCRKDIMPTLTSKGGLLNRNSWKKLWSAIGLSLLDKKTKSEYRKDIIPILTGKNGLRSRDPWKRLWAAIGLFLFDKETRTEYREEIESALPGEIGLKSSSPWKRMRAAVSLSLLDKKTASRYKEDIIYNLAGKDGLKSGDPWKRLWAAIGLLSIDKGKRIFKVNIHYTGLKRPHTILAKDANELAAKLQKEVFTGLGISCQALSDKRIELSTRYAYGKTVTEAIDIYPEEKLEKTLLKVLAPKVFTASPEFSTAVKFPPDVKSYKDILQDLIDLEARRKDKLVNTLRIMKKPVSLNRISKSTNKDGYGDGLRLVHGLPQGARDNFNAVMEQNHGIGYWTAYLAGVRVRQTLEKIANQLRAEQIKAEKSQARFKYSDAGFIVDARIHHREFLQLQFSEGVVKQLLALFKEISGAKRRSPSVFIEAMEKYNYPNIVSAIHINPDETMRNWRWEYLILVDDYGVDKIIYATVKPGKKPPYVINYHNIRITALDKFVKFVLPFIEELSKENPEAAECWNETLKRIGPQDTAGLAKSSSAGKTVEIPVSGKANNIRCFSEQVLNERLSASPGLERELQKVLELCERRLKPSKNELAVFLGAEKLDPSSLRVYAQVKRHPDDLPGKVTIAHTIRNKEGYLLFALFSEQEASAVEIPYSPQERKPDQARDGLIKERKMALIKTIDGKEVSPPRTVELTVGDKILVISIEPADYRNRMGEGSATLRDMQRVRTKLAFVGGTNESTIRQEIMALGLEALHYDSLEYLGTYKGERVFVIESIYFDEMFFFSDKCVESLSNESTEMIRLSADGHMGVVRQIKPAKSSSAGVSDVVEVGMANYAPPIPVITTPPAYAELIKMGLGDKLRILVGIFNKELKDVTALDDIKHWIPLKELKKDTIEQIYFIGYKIAMDSMPPSRVYGVRTKSGIELVVSPDSEIPQLAEVPEAIALCDAKAAIKAAAKSSSAGEVVKQELQRLCNEFGISEDKLVSKILSSLVPSQFITDVAEAGGRPTKKVVEELKNITWAPTMLESLIHRYEEKTNSLIPVAAPLPPGFKLGELMELISDITKLQKTSPERMIDIFFNCIEPTTFIENFVALANLSDSKESRRDLAIRLTRDYPTLALVGTAYRVMHLEDEPKGKTITLKAEDIVNPAALSGYGPGLLNIKVTLPETLWQVDENKYKAVMDHFSQVAKAAANRKYNYRGEVLEYYQRFMQTEVRAYRRFIKKNFGNRDNIKYLITSGIGANEMYFYLMADLHNSFEGGIRWIVIDEPADISSLPEDATASNSLYFEVSRSGETQETEKLLQFLHNRFPKRIVYANKGPLRISALALGKKPGHSILVKFMPQDIGGRLMRRKSPILLGPMYLAGMDTKAYAEATERFDKQLSFTNGPGSLAVGLARFLYVCAVLGNRHQMVIMYNQKRFLLASAEEINQLLMEGANKKQEYKLTVSLHALARDAHRSIEGIYGQAASSVGLGIIARRSGFESDDKTKLTEADLAGLEKDPTQQHLGLSINEVGYTFAVPHVRKCQRIMPTISIEVDSVTTEVAAALSSLWEDLTVHYCALTGQDPNSNAEVKAVREDTADLLTQMAQTKRASKPSSAGTFTVDIEDVRYVISGEASDYLTIPAATQADLKKMLVFLERDEVSKASYREISGPLFKNLDECPSLSQIFVEPFGLMLGEQRVYGFKDVGPAKERRIYIVFPNQPRPELEKVKLAAEWSAGKIGILVSKEGVTKLIMLGNRPSISIETTDEGYDRLIKMGLGDGLRKLVQLLIREFKNVSELDEFQQQAAIDKSGLEIERLDFLGFKLSLPVGSPSSRVYALRLKPDLDLVILPESHIPHLMDAPNALILCDAKIGIVAKAKSSSAGEVEIPVSGKANNIRCFSEQVLNERLSASPGLERELQKVLELCERRFKPSKDELAVFLGPERLDPSSLRVYAQVKRHPDDLPGKVTIAHTIRDKEGDLLFALFTEQEASAVEIPYSPQERRPDQARDGLIKERKMALIESIDGKEVSPPRTVELTVGNKILVISIEPADYRNRMSEGSATLREMQEVRSILASLGSIMDIYSIRSELKTLGLLALNCDSLEYLGKYEDERVFVIESIYFDEMFFFSDKCVESLSNESTEMIRLSADGHMGVVRQIKPAKSSSAGQVEFIMNTVAERLAGFFFLPADRLNVEAIGDLKVALKEQKSRLTGLGKLSCPVEDAVRAGLAITLGNYLQAIDECERLALVNDGFNKILKEISPEKTDLKLHHYQPAETDVIGTIIINEDELQEEQKNEMVRLFSKISKYRAEAIEKLGANVVLKNEYNRDEDWAPHMVAISKNPIPAAKEARLLAITIEHTPDALLPVDKGLLFAKGLLLYLVTDRTPEVEVKLSELYRLLRKRQGEPLQETGLLEKFIDERVFTLLLPKPERVDKEQYQKLLRLRLLTLIAA